MQIKTHDFVGSSLLHRASWIEHPGEGSPTIDPELYPVLVIQMHAQGGNAPSLYHYYKVPESRFDALCIAESAGSFYNKNIKGVFSSKKVI